MSGALDGWLVGWLVGWLTCCSPKPPTCLFSAGSRCWQSLMTSFLTRTWLLCCLACLRHSLAARRIDSQVPRYFGVCGTTALAKAAQPSHSTEGMYVRTYMHVKWQQQRCRSAAHPPTVNDHPRTHRLLVVCRCVAVCLWCPWRWWWRCVCKRMYVCMYVCRSAAAAQLPRAALR